MSSIGWCPLPFAAGGNRYRRRAGRAILTIISAIAELERSLIVERVRSAMRCAKLEGRQIGRARLNVDREQVVLDRRSGMSLTLVAKKPAFPGRASAGS